MKKREIVEQIIIVLDWAKKNWESLTKEVKKAIVKALRKDIWYASNINTTKALMRFTKEDLQCVLHDVVEAIY